MDHHDDLQQPPVPETSLASASSSAPVLPRTSTAATQTLVADPAPPPPPLVAAPSALATRRRKGHRGGKKKKKRPGMSYLDPANGTAHDDMHPEAHDTRTRDSFYTRPGASLSNTSFDSVGPLDHRAQTHFMRPRRPSIMGTSSSQALFATTPSNIPRLAKVPGGDSSDEADGKSSPASARGMHSARGTWDERTPLLSSSSFGRADTAPGAASYRSGEPHTRKKSRPGSPQSSRSSLRKKMLSPFVGGPGPETYNINYPPSVPGSPRLRSADRMEMSFGDLMLVRDTVEAGQRTPPARRPGGMGDIEGENGMPPLFQPTPLDRRNTVALQAEEDVCFPQEGLSELAEDEAHPPSSIAHRMRTRRSRGKWPDLAILEEWSRFEREGRSEERRSKKITEPQLINGRLRPVHKGWYRSEDDAPYRFTYFNEEFQSTIHSQTISELVQAGCDFRGLFVPDPPLMSDSSDDEAEPEESSLHQVLGSQSEDLRNMARQASVATTSQSYQDNRRESGGRSPMFDGCQSASPKETTPPGDGTPAATAAAAAAQQQQQQAPPRRTKSPETVKPPRYGDRPVWWLDVLSPTDAEMKVLAKAFGIHPLTAEDIMMQEQREKVELFRNYYFVNYRTFDQDQTSENFLEPVNMYVVVFREGVLSFHFDLTPHPANVRRRIRQLRDYLLLSSDWISYGIIDDITDAFGPLIQSIEDEVDDIDDAILKLHTSAHHHRDTGYGHEQHNNNNNGNSNIMGGGGRSTLLRDAEKSEGDGEGATADSAGDMLRRVGDCRKKVMSLYRLLSNKADVIKGFAKRCNEHWEVAPRSEIGLYLGDIQDHIVTMTSNLGHYEKILSRSHANYLAQINIRMNERQEQTADVLGKLTVLGTIVLPMNIITGLWGMNVWVPGQAHENDLTWFAFITAGLLAFGVGCYLLAKRVYKIV